MGLFSPSSSSVTAPTNSTLGASATDYAKLLQTSIGPVTAGGGKNSSTNINVQTVDPGLVTLADAALGKAFDVGQATIGAAIQLASDTQNSAFDFATQKGGSESLQLLDTVGKDVLILAGLIALVLIFRK